MDNVSKLMNEVAQLEKVLNQLTITYNTMFIPREGTSFFNDGVIGYNKDKKHLLVRISNVTTIKMDLSDELDAYEQSLIDIIEVVKKTHESKKKILESIDTLLGGN